MKIKGGALIIGVMNAVVGDRELEGIVGKFGISGMNENGRKLRKLPKNDGGKNDRKAIRSK